MTAFHWIAAHEKGILRTFVVLLIIVLMCFAWARSHPARPGTFESQQQASTPAGVEQDADNAQVPISPAQASAIAHAIQQDADKPPIAVVQTAGGQLQQIVAKETQKFKADFAIVTDPKNPSTAIKPAAILPNTPVVLNQYNVQAYPDHLIQVGGSYMEVFAAYSWKTSVPKIPLIAPHGDIGYLGFYAHANLDHPETSRIGIMLTIPK